MNFKNTKKYFYRWVVRDDTLSELRERERACMISFQFLRKIRHVGAVLLEMKFN